MKPVALWRSPRLVLLAWLFRNGVGVSVDLTCGVEL